MCTAHRPYCDNRADTSFLFSLNLGSPEWSISIPDVDGTILTINSSSGVYWAGFSEAVHTFFVLSFPSYFQKWYCTLTRQRDKLHIEDRGDLRLKIPICGRTSPILSGITNSTGHSDSKFLRARKIRAVKIQSYKRIYLLFLLFFWNNIV